MKLPGWTFMVVGAIVVAYTKFIGDDHLRFFFWVGIAFLVYGFFKELAHRLVRPKPRPTPANPPVRREQELDHRHPAGQRFDGQSPHASHQHTRPQQYPSHPHVPAQKGCPRCHATNVGHANFCHGCGQRL